MAIWDDIKRAKRDIKRAFGRAEEAFTEIGKLDDRIKDLTKNRGAIWNAISELRDFRDEIEDLPNTIERTAERVARDVQKALLREATKKALGTAVDLIDTVMPDSLGLTLGPVNIQIGDVFEKVEAIKEIAEDPPDDCESITEAVMALAPDEISIDLSIGVGFIVQSDSAQVGVSLGWSKESVLEHLPKLLAKCGVPE